MIDLELVMRSPWTSIIIFSSIFIIMYMVILFHSIWFKSIHGQTVTKYLDHDSISVQETIIVVSDSKKIMESIDMINIDIDVNRYGVHTFRLVFDGMSMEACYKVFGSQLLITNLLELKQSCNLLSGLTQSITVLELQNLYFRIYVDKRRNRSFVSGKVKYSVTFEIVPLYSLDSGQTMKLKLKPR